MIVQTGLNSWPYSRLWCDYENIAAHHLSPSLCRVFHSQWDAWLNYKILCILFLQLKLFYSRWHVWNGIHLLLWIRKHYPLLESDAKELAALRRNATRIACMRLAHMHQTFSTQISFHSLPQWIQWICARLLRGLRPFKSSIQLFSHSSDTQLVVLHCQTIMRCTRSTKYLPMYE